MRDPTNSFYVPTTALPRANQLKVSVFYSKGGMNYANYKTEPRGYYVAVEPVTVGAERGFITERHENLFTNTRSFKVFLTPATRLNRKALAALAAKLGPVAPALVAPLALEPPDKVTVMDLVMAAVAA
jgi:hypothetical protein